MLGKMMDALKSPGGDFTWTQLAGATVFVLVVALMWRQVTHYIMREI
jgi:hypothetical protein